MWLHLAFFLFLEKKTEKKVKTGSKPLEEPHLDGTQLVRVLNLIPNVSKLRRKYLFSYL